MKLDVDVLRYLSKDDFRVLTAVEMGMRNHEIVPSELIASIASLKRGGSYKVLKNLLKHKLVHHEAKKYDGYRLTYLGYDFLAIKTMVHRGVFSGVGRLIGTGKESDIFEVVDEDGTVKVMKLHRLGRISFRAVKSKRDYLKHRSSYNWLYLSRLAALKEFAFMKALEEHGFPVPNAIDCNRHCVIMSRVQAYPLSQVREMQNPEAVFEKILNIVVRLAEHGLIHCDFNEFNIMINDDEEVTMIDFPQMVSVSHPNAEMYFDRDVECVCKFFRRKFRTISEYTAEPEVLDSGSDSDEDENGRPCFSSISKTAGFLDKELEASGFTRKNQEYIEKHIEGEGETSDHEGNTDTEDSDVATDEVIEHIDFLSLKEQDGPNEAVNEVEPEQQVAQSSEGNGVETPDADDKGEDEGEEETKEEENPELAKSLYKQRKRAIAAAKRGHRSLSSRNSYKDKGDKSNSNSKIQKQLGAW